MKIERGTAQGVLDDSYLKGWVIGHMVQEGGLGRTNDFEIKLWRYDRPIPEYGKKMFGGEGEFIIVEGGVLQLKLEKEGAGQIVTLRGDRRDFIILGEGILKETMPFEMPTWGVTVRWPSQKSINKQVVPGVVSGS